LFVAINLPASVRDGIWEIAAPLRKAGYPFRWVHRDAMHLTLKFLGDVDSERVRRIEEELDRAVADSKRFVLPLGGFGTFPNPKRPRVVWLGCEGVPQFELLQHGVERAMQDLGFPSEGRPFRPHLTLGRVKRGASASTLRGLDEALAGLQYAAEPMVASVDLMESLLGVGPGGGARYERRYAGRRYAGELGD
jgi:2'-5' RNA ligase